MMKFNEILLKHIFYKKIEIKRMKQEKLLN